MEFVKMHGIGNDFVLVDLLAGGKERDWSKLATQICHRAFGVGADGLVLIHKKAGVDAQMTIYNSDGSEAKMCGNALRCVTAYLASRGLVQKTQVRIATASGLRTAQIRESSVQVNMGEPIWKCQDIPVAADQEEFIKETIQTPQGEYEVSCVSMGNPHCVIFVPDVAQIDLQTVGPLLEHHEMFPQGINVEFVQIETPHRLNIRVWERGAGITLACGTGACAAVAVAARLGLVEKTVDVSLPGGTLDIRWAPDNHIYMSGPTEEVFTGKYKAR